MSRKAGQMKAQAADEKAKADKSSRLLRYVPCSPHGMKFGIFSPKK